MEGVTLGTGTARLPRVAGRTIKIGDALKGKTELGLVHSSAGSVEKRWHQLRGEFKHSKHLVTHYKKAPDEKTGAPMKWKRNPQLPTDI